LRFPTRGKTAPLTAVYGSSTVLCFCLVPFLFFIFFYQFGVPRVNFTSSHASPLIPPPSPPQNTTRGLFQPPPPSLAPNARRRGVSVYNAANTVPSKRIFRTPSLQMQQQDMFLFSCFSLFLLTSLRQQPPPRVHAPISSARPARAPHHPRPHMASLTHTA
jgi:hypothetical protein